MPQRYFVALALWVTRDEFAEDPHDLLANLLLHTVQHLSVDAQRFAGLYLLGHEVIKLWLVVGLLRERLWYFPVSIVVFALFIAYQAYRYTYTHSVWLLLVTALDIVIVALTPVTSTSRGDVPNRQWLKSRSTVTVTGLVPDLQ